MPLLILMDGGNEANDWHSDDNYKYYFAYNGTLVDENDAASLNDEDVLHIYSIPWNIFNNAAFWEKIWDTFRPNKLYKDHRYFAFDGNAKAVIAYIIDSFMYPGSGSGSGP